MASLNDFKLVNIKSKKMFSFIKNVRRTDLNDVQKSRMGFYHLVLENVTGVRDADDVSEMIIDTDYNKLLYGKTVNDLGIDAINYIGDDNEQEITVQLFNFKFRENYKVDKNMEESSVNGSIKFLEYNTCCTFTAFALLAQPFLRFNFRQVARNIVCIRLLSHDC